MTIVFILSIYISVHIFNSPHLTPHIFNAFGLAVLSYRPYPFSAPVSSLTYHSLPLKSIKFYCSLRRLNTLYLLSFYRFMSCDISKQILRSSSRRNVWWRIILAIRKYHSHWTGVFRELHAFHTDEIWR